QANTYDHTHWKTRDPVRSPIDKPVRAGLVVGSVTTSESPVLYVFLPHFQPLSLLPALCRFSLCTDRSMCTCHPRYLVSRIILSHLIGVTRLRQDAAVKITMFGAAGASLGWLAVRGG
ncbi:hypothetical protein B0T14DRAFT_587877, partial [Immersiella caudata]